MTKGSVPSLLVTNSPCLARKQAAYRNGEASFKGAEHSPAELSRSLIPLWLVLPPDTTHCCYYCDCSRCCCYCLCRMRREAKGMQGQQREGNGLGRASQHCKCRHSPWGCSCPLTQASSRQTSLELRITENRSPLPLKILGGILGVFGEWERDDSVGKVLTTCPGWFLSTRHKPGYI